MEARTSCSLSESILDLFPFPWVLNSMPAIAISLSLDLGRRPRRWQIHCPSKTDKALYSDGH